MRRHSPIWFGNDCALRRYETFSQKIRTVAVIRHPRTLRTKRPELRAARRRASRAWRTPSGRLTGRASVRATAAGFRHGRVRGLQTRAGLIVGVAQVAQSVCVGKKKQGLVTWTRGRKRNFGEFDHTHPNMYVRPFLGKILLDIRTGSSRPYLRTYRFDKHLLHSNTRRCLKMILLKTVTRVCVSIVEPVFMDGWVGRGGYTFLKCISGSEMINNSITSLLNVSTSKKKS